LASISVSIFFTFSTFSWSSVFLSSISRSFLSNVSSRLSRRCCIFRNSWRRSSSSFFASSMTLIAFSFASRMICCSCVFASVSFFSAIASTFVALPFAIFIRRTYPIPRPASPPTRARARLMVDIIKNMCQAMISKNIKKLWKIGKKPLTLDTWVVDIFVTDV